MGKVFVFLADGFEEIEALTPVDVLRRAEVDVVTVGVSGQWIEGSHNICIQADLALDDYFELPKETVAIVLPGGMPGTRHLCESEVVKRCVRLAAQQGCIVAAICAAPLVLQAEGMLRGRRFTAFPGVVEGATGAAVEVDENLITARGAGVALDFSKALLAAIKGDSVASEIVAKMQPHTIES